MNHRGHPHNLNWHVPSSRIIPRSERIMDRLEQRNTGAFYTPAPVARFMVARVLESISKRASFKNKVIKILDPACGDGVFLSALVEAIMMPRKKIHPPHDVVVKVFGLDIDRNAVDKAKDNLQSLLNNLDGVRDPIDLELIVGNALKDDWNENSQEFDVIIGNPPYIPWHNIPSNDRAMLESGTYLDMVFSCRPGHGDSQPNYYLFFLVLANNLLNDEGIISFILPQEWLYHEKSRDFRNYLLENFGEIHMLELHPEIKVFDNPGQPIRTNTLILTLFKKGKKMIYHEFVHKFDGKDIVEILNNREKKNLKRHDFEGFHDAAWKFLPAWKLEVKEHVQSQDVISLSNADYFEVRGGFQPPVKQAKSFEITRTDIRGLNDLERSMVFPLVFHASEITRYKVFNNPRRFWIVANEIDGPGEFEKECPVLHEILSSRLVASENHWWHFPNIRNLPLIRETDQKLLSPRTAPRPTFALDLSKSVFKGTNTMIISKILPVKYVLAILNSSLSAFWYESFGFDYHGGNAMKYEPSKAKKHLIPIKREPIPVQDELVAMVDALLSMKTRGDRDGAARLEMELDDFVLELYNMSKETFLREKR